MGRMDGPCAVHALTCLNWDPNYDADRINRIQNAQFGALGMRMADGDRFTAFLNRKVMVLFFYTWDPVAFHVMYTDGCGHLCGVNNNPVMLRNMLGVTDIAEGNERGECIYNLENMTVNHHDHIYIKYVTKDLYTAFYP